MPKKRSRNTKRSVMSKPKCQFWPDCYQKNANHLAKFSHPPKDDTDGSALTDTSTKGGNKITAFFNSKQQKRSKETDTSESSVSKKKAKTDAEEHKSKNITPAKISNPKKQSPKKQSPKKSVSKQDADLAIDSSNYPPEKTQQEVNKLSWKQQVAYW